MQAEVLDAWAVETALERLLRPDAASLLRPAPEVDVPGRQTRQRALEARRAELTALVASGRRTLAEIAPHDDEIVAELGKVKSELAEAYRVDPLADVLSAADVREYWEGLSLGRQRAVLGALMEPIITPAGKGWRVVPGEPKGRQVSVSEVVRPAWRRVLLTDEGMVPGLTDRARDVLGVPA